jgi:DNA-binding transcriptional ArsR family regulator
MNGAVDHLHRRLAAIAHVSRLRIALALAARERHVSELAEVIGLSQSCTTRHLQALVRDGVVACRRSGKRVLARLRLDDPEVRGLIAWLRPGAIAPAGPAAVRAATTRAPRRPRASSASSARTTRRPARDAVDQEDRAHAGSIASDTPPPASTPAPSAGGRGAGRASRPGDLDDYLL